MVKRPTKSRDISDIPFPPSTMETIDSAVYKFLDETLDINCITTTGFKKVPVIWAAAERAYQSKNRKIRDHDGTLILPLITVERTAVSKDPSRKGTVYANIPPMDKVKGGSISVSRKINQDKTSNFAYADSRKRKGQIKFAQKNEKIVYQTVSIPLPVYVTVRYDITLRTDYLEQMNQVVTPFITRPGGINYVILEEGRLRYEAFIQEDFSQNNNLSNFTNEERKFETKLSIEVLGWLTGEDANRMQPNYAIRENAVEIKIPRERVALRDDLDKSVGRLYGLAGIPVNAGMIPFRKASDPDAISGNAPVRIPGEPSSGASPVSIDTVRMVDYELIIDLTDGSSINVGNVRGATGATPDLDVISGSLATYHTFDGDKGVFNDLDVGGTSRFEGDVTVVGRLIGGSPLKVSSSLAIIGDDGSTIALLGSSSLGANVLSASLATTDDLTVSGTVKFTGLSAGSAQSTKYLALDASDNVVLTSSSGTGGGGGNGTIGAAEDGDYSDGLFTDFTSNTLIGVPIDRFNEVLKILAPSPAPDLRSIEDNISNGVTAKLSFGSSQTVPHYSSSATAAGFTAVDINGSYSPTNSGRNLRIGVYDGAQDITGILNDNVAASVTNTYVAYASGAYGNAETGVLKLELNGNIIHSINLSEFNGAGNPGSGTDSSLNSDTSGFTNTSITASSFDGNNAEWNIFKHRTGRFKVDVNSMVPGWNYVRVIHTFGGTDKTTNFIEWINDPSGSVNNLSATNSRIEDVALVGSKFISGVEYNTDATANYKVDLSNLYQNVYQASGTPISFTVSNSTTPSAQSVPSIDNGAGENSTKVLGITASLDVNTNTLVSGAITANVTATHPLKSTLSNGGSATTGNGFLIDNRTLASTNLAEKFHDETYRKASGSYDTQSSVTLGSNEWNSRNHMTASGATGHQDGLLYFDQKLYSPVDADIPNNGNFAALSNVKSGQPNYSGVTGTRTFFRVLSNSSGVTKRDIKIVTTKNGTTFNNSSLSTANAHLYVKIPGQTGWMDASQNFVFGRIDTDDGALISGASNDVDSGNNTHHLTFGSASVANGECIMVKIEADESWAGYISQLDFTLGATTNTATAAPVLDDIDVNDTGLNDANLSFGASHTIPNYSSATGSSISLTNFDTNANYGVSGDRRGVFSSYTVIDGDLNEDVTSNGNNYPANAFNDGLDGSLVLEVNGTEVHTVTISGTTNAIVNDFNGNSSGFSVSSVSWSTTTDNIPDYTKPHRTGTYQIGTADQRLGWNYARVIHRKSGGDQQTNYVEWVVDTDSNALGSSSLVFNDFYHSDVFKQSGVGYFASRPTASYEYLASNVYRNVYQNGTAITFPTNTNCSISNIRISGSGVTTKSTPPHQHH